MCDWLSSAPISLFEWDVGTRQRVATSGVERAKMVEKTEFGTLPSGETAHVFTLKAGDITVRVSDFGATVLGIEVPDAQGNIADVVLGHKDLAGYAGPNDAFYGATVAPVANRTAGGEIPVGVKTYQLPKNDHEANNLHTDKDHGLHKRLWTEDYAAETDHSATLQLSYHLDSGDLYLPGSRLVTARFTVSAPATLTIAYQMETDRPTFANITNHSYFNLAGHASGDVRAQTMQIRADRFVCIDEASIPTGELREVDLTPFDFHEAHALGDQIDADYDQIANARGYDHCFVIDGYEPDAAPRLAMRAEDPASGRVMEVYLTTPGVQLYTGNWLGDADGKDGASYGQNDGFAIEPEFYPDCVHHEDWPQPRVTASHPFKSVIEYEFSTVER